MNSKEKRELAVSEIALVIIALIGLLVVVWLAWIRPSHKEPVNSYDACVAAGNPVQMSYPSACVTKEGKRFINPDQSASKEVKAAQTQQAYLSIPQWDVRIPLTSATADLTFSYDKTDTYEGVFFSFTRLSSVGVCKDDVGVALSRSSTQNQPPYNVDNPKAFKKIGDYYYYQAYGSSPCYNTEDSTQVAAVKAINDGNLKDLVAGALAGLEAVPSD